MARLRALGSSSLLLTRRRIERSLAGLCSPGRAACIVFVFCAVAAISSLAASTFTTVVNFKVTNGARPRHASLAQGLDGKLYGTTPGGGAHLYGTVFTLSGPLYSFCAQANCTDGSAPSGGLVLATDGDFYGTTGLGGANGDGTVFKITHSGTLTTLYSFCSKLAALTARPLLQLWFRPMGISTGQRTEAGPTVAAPCSKLHRAAS